MTDTAAPLFSDLDGVPSGGQAFWIQSSDNIRLRAAVWRTGSAGTVLILPGRTEYIEKYGPTLALLAARNLSAIVIDWRGQGLSDRRGKTPMQGYVGRYGEYQDDLAAVLEHDAVSSLPGPRVLLGHSMGGCIGLRALTRGLKVCGAIFSAPMWGLAMTPSKRVLAHLVTQIAPAVGQNDEDVPGFEDSPYVTTAPFENNVLTGDREAWTWLGDQLRAHPDLGLGAPSVAWLGASMREITSIAKARQPDLPILTLLGSDERVVSSTAIKLLTRRQAGARLEIFEHGRHEMLFDIPSVRDAVWRAIDGFIEENLST